MAKPSDQVKIAKEIEKKAVELGKTSTDDSAPFNFQVYSTSYNTFDSFDSH